MDSALLTTAPRDQGQDKKMTTFVITEKQNVSSVRNGTTVEAIDLASAKRKASNMQMFKGTVITIETEGGVLLSVKQGGKWEDRA